MESRAREEFTNEPSLKEQLMAGAGDLVFEDVLSSHPHLRSALSPFDPFRAASSFAGLLTEPSLQSNCCRLEVLVNLAVAFCTGTRKPSKPAINKWFSDLSSGLVGKWEDPAEDVFISNIATTRGNFRVFEGTWESSGFFLQRCINVVEGMPDEGDFLKLKNSVFALLKLSDLICDRSDLQRFSSGSPEPQDVLPDSIVKLLPKLRKRVEFNPSELSQHGVALAAC